MTQPHTVKVGILIPTFNRKTYLVEALHSSCSQTYDKIEIIVIDNGSTDGTTAFMTSVSDQRVRYVVNENNIGMIGSINKGINLFSDEVEWCTVLSDDDILDKDFIMRLLNTAITFAAKSIVHSHRIFIDKQGNRIREAVLSPQEETALDYIRMRANSRRETYLTGVLFNRNAFKEIKGYPSFATGLASDDAFIFALSLKDRLLFERTTCAFIRIHEEAESISNMGVVRKIQTIREFGDYCRRAAREFGNFTPEQMRSFYLMIKGYIKALNSYWWLRNVHAIIDQNINMNDELHLLNSLVMHDSHAFSLRIRLNILLEKMMGVNPETYKTYRYLWNKAGSVVLRVQDWLSSTRSARRPPNGSASEESLLTK
jgi:glycosyltransferase involved in cell wall biosynthesis